MEDYGVSYAGSQMYTMQATTAGSAPTGSGPIGAGTGSGMEWLGAIGAITGGAAQLGSVVTGVVGAFDGTNKTLAQAQLTSAQAQADAVTAAREQARLNAATTREMMVYGLIGVGVVVVGAIAYRAVA